MANQAEGAEQLQAAVGEARLAGEVLAGSLVLFPPPVLFLSLSSLTYAALYIYAFSRVRLVSVSWSVCPS